MTCQYTHNLKTLKMKVLSIIIRSPEKKCKYILCRIKYIFKNTYNYRDDLKFKYCIDLLLKS